MVSSKNVTCSGTCYCQYYNDISKEGYLNIIKSQYIISVVPTLLIKIGFRKRLYSANS